MAVYESVHELVGKTPLVALHAFPLPEGVRIYAKCEYFNPGGSVKDRLGEKLIREAMQSGKLKPGGTLIEPTAGNTGIGLALAAVGKGINVIFCVPEKFSAEKQVLMKALGARVVTTPTDQGMSGAVAKARQLERTIEGGYCPNQFANSDNPRTYFETLGPEIWDDLDGKVDVLIAGAGTGGTFTGTAEYLKMKNPDVKTVVVEPVGSILNGGKPAAHRTEGIGMEFIPSFVKTKYFDEIYTIEDQDAFRRLKEAAKYEGLLIGSSSGSALHAALLEAEKSEPGTTIVVIFPDSSERYLGEHIYE
ncbi:PLP-dependent cysteine synthase family protein [Sporolactobacillus nakayamae]|uniref:O-acetylserine dependent cystathionine beta-synthase n=1 Tax=Sporolactobacillus nakayamae TaxID=269670 RepID=A0A1I2NUG7_9BACL|nr:cysteine synthase family protein [Sporolactobacillus nakayamae]SFG07532.1 O-acetylserine dependent cystathionine beta-synthase [Sporolactobacillus nakayamae]